MHSTKIYIDPTSRILYSSFYIQGLYEIFGRKNVSFKRKYFKGLVRKEELYSYNHYFAFVMVNEDRIFRYIIDFCDPPDISQKAYDWCDVYGKINFNKSCGINDSSKIVIISPSFGIRIWNFPETIFYCCTNFISSFLSIPVKSLVFFKDYWKQYKRLPLDYYLIRSERNKENYIFMIGTFWNSEVAAKKTNRLRMHFIKSCLEVEGVNFEGGLYATKNHPNYLEFESYIFTSQYSLKDYINKTKSSTIVFNTPAVHDCHGWKLAEFLALGKPILSTPLSNELLEKLSHGEEIHIIETENDIKKAIIEVMNNANYRKKLSENAFNYFMQYVSPSQVIKLMMRKTN